MMRRRWGPTHVFWDGIAALQMEDVYTVPNMTLAIAVEARDGVVLAADSVETRSDGSLRSGIRKIVKISDSTYVAVSGTGNVAKGILEQPGLLVRARELRDPAAIGNYLGSCFLGTMQGYSHSDEWFNETYDNKDGIPSPEVLSLAVVLASYSGKPVVGRVFHGSGYRFEPVEGSVCLGMDGLCNALLPAILPLRQPLLSLDEAVLACAFCLLATSERFYGVGAPFDFVTVSPRGAEEFSSEDRPDIMQRARATRESLRGLFEAMAGSPSSS
jgi:hypothetical protein